MSDKTMKDIVSGKGLKPISSNNNSNNNNNSGVTTERREGITYETANYKRIKPKK